MNAQRSKRMAAIGVLAAIVLVVAVLLTQPALSKGLVAKILGSATGTQMQIGGMELHGNHATLTNVQVSAKGEHLADIPRIEVAYNLHDLLPGSKHLYGLHAITVYRPRVTVVHKADGTYNLPSLGKGGPSKPGGTPMNFTMRVIDGSLAVLDKQRIDPTARDVEVANLNFDANVNTAERTTYKATMAYTDGRAQYPIRGGGLIDTPAGYTLHHWTAAHVPLPQLVNYALNNSSIRMTAGYLDNLDARYYGSLSASASMRGARISMAGVKAPIDNVHGPLDVTSAGMTTSGLTATVAGAPVYVRGGIYDLKNPQFRITVDTQGELDRLKLMATPIAHLPLKGPVALSMLVQGTVKKPLALISLRSPGASFKDLPLRDVDGSVAFDGKTASLLHFTLRYAGFSAAVRGRVALQKEPNAIEAFASADGSSSDLPYAVSLLPDMPLHASMLATGDSFTTIQTQGSLYGSGGSSQLASAFAIGSNGVGNVDLDLQNELAARISIDHPHNRIAALVHANGLTIDGSHIASLPGLRTAGLPPMRATVNGNLFAVQQNGRLGLNGTAGVSDAVYNGITIAQANATFGGGPGNMNLARINAQGSFGTLSAHGTFAGTNHVALEGRLHGSLAALSSMAGHLPATGTVDAPIALVYDRGRAIAQVQDARFAHAGIRGIPLDGLSATIAQNRGALDVYAAHAQIAHSGSAVAAGSIGRSGSHLAVSVANLPVAALHGAGVPLRSGTANLAATASGSLSAPNVRGAVVVDRAQYGKFPVSAGTAFTYSGDTLALQNGLVGLGPAFVALDGSVGGVALGQPMHPSYDLVASLRGADADDMLAVLSPAARKQYIEGSLNADVRVTGSGASPTIDGTFNAPEGSVHGLAFRDLAGTINGTPSDIAIDNGHVTVGSTTVAFNASVAGKHLAGNVNAPHADLADFNDYFDQGDTLAGTGRLAVSVDSFDRSVASSGNVALNDVRYKRFPIGTTDAVWTTDGQTTTARANIGGEAGTLAVNGTYSPQSQTDMHASVRNLDLATWLPLLGMREPVTGHIDADGTARGKFPDLDLAMNASLIDGVVGRVQVQQAQVALTASHGHGTLQRAVVRIPNLLAQGSGTFGLHANDPLALTMRAQSPDLGKLMTTVTGKQYDASGTLDTTLAVNGTRANPLVRDDFTLAQLHYNKVDVPKMSGTLTGDKKTIALRHGEIDFKRGTIVATGHAPVRMTRNAPVDLHMQIANVDFSDFQSAFPKGYTLAGTMGGNLNVGGNIDQPQFTGSIALHNGYFVGPIDQNPISKMNGTLVFNGTHIAVQALHADVGGGTMDVTADANVPNFRRPGDSTFTSHIIANGAQINNPKYFRGKINADITASRNVGDKNAMIAGNVDLPSARIPLTAFWNPKAPKASPGPPLPIAFNMHATVGNDVRVQSSGVDVGAQGQVAIGGTISSPTLNGAFSSTGGSVTFLRRFNIQSARVRFDPQNGIMPYVNAVATTTLTNPVTDIALHVTGLAPDNMQISFDSDQGYSRDQILAMLTGVSSLNNPGASTGGFSAGGELQNLAMGQLNTYFTQSLLEPLSSSLGSAMGLQDLSLTDDFTSGFGINAAKAFGKHITAVFTQTMGTPSRRSLSIEAHRGNSTAFNFMMYSSDAMPLTGYNPSQTLFGYNDTTNANALMPLLGTNGFTMTYEHKFQ